MTLRHAPRLQDPFRGDSVILASQVALTKPIVWKWPLLVGNLSLRTYFVSGPCGCVGVYKVVLQWRIYPRELDQ